MKLNNDNIDAKVEFRRRYVTGQDRVLDLFAGQNSIWSRLPFSYYQGIDKTFRGKFNNIKGDSYKLAPFLDLSSFTIIDIDCYGLPWRMLELIMNNTTLPSSVRFFLTHISFYTTQRQEAPVFAFFRKNFSKCLSTEEGSLHHHLRPYCQTYDFYTLENSSMQKLYLTFQYVNKNAQNLHN